MKKPPPTSKGSKRRPASHSKATVSLPTEMRRLITQTQKDQSAPFKPKSVEALRKLKSSDKQAYEQARAQLKAAGCRVSELDKAIGNDGQNQDRRPNQSDILLELASDLNLFHSADGTAYADANIETWRETWPVRSREFKRWLLAKFHEETGSAPSTDAVRSAIDLVEAQAVNNGPTMEVFTRVASIGDTIYLDLGDREWRAVEIDKDGRRVVDRPPVRFRRMAGMLPLPEPATVGDINELREFLSLESENHFVLIVGWMVSALRSEGPYPALLIMGEQGSAKSSSTGFIRSLIDPNVVTMRPLPRNEQELFISTKNCHVLTYDNLSKLQIWQSDGSVPGRGVNLT